MGLDDIFAWCVLLYVARSILKSLPVLEFIFCFLLLSVCFWIGFDFKIPFWGCILIVVVMLGLYVLYKKRKGEDE